MLEAFGFRVIDERTYTVVPRDGVDRYLHDMVLEPGDVITTGTPPGVGPIRPGQTISVAVEGIGELRNPVR